MMNININLSELDINELGAWPWLIKVPVIAVMSIALVFIIFFLDTKKQLASLETAEHDEISLRTTFETKQSKSANLEAYKEQMVTMKASFGALLRQLPEKTEVPGLLEDISHQGLATGLEFRTIRLQPEKQIDFYVEMPIEISVVGNYHQFGEFVSNIAALPRIVTLHDFVIRPIIKGGSPDELLMSITAKTYRYTANEDETKKANANANKKPSK